jgi:hypothetical protein
MTTYDEYHYHEAIANLKDTTNQSWNINDPTAKYAMTAQIKVNLDEIAPEDVEVIFSFTDPDTGVTTSPITDFKFKYTGQEVKFDVEVYVLKKDSAGNVTERILLDPYQEPTSTGSTGTGDYVVLWFNNINVTDNGASLSIMALPASGYDFELGSLDEYDPPSLHYKQFSIYKDFPDYLQLTDSAVTPHNVHVRKITSQVSGSSYMMGSMVINYDDREALLTTPDTTLTYVYMLTGFYQGQTIDSLIPLFNNPLDRITIEENNVVIFDGAVSQNYLLDEFGNEDTSKPISSYKIKTGLKVCLFADKDDRVNSVDSLEIVLYGDTNGDGDINNNDALNIITSEWATRFRDFINDGTYLTPYYQASLVKDVETFKDPSYVYGDEVVTQCYTNNNDILRIISHFSNKTNLDYDINKDYYVSAS